MDFEPLFFGNTIRADLITPMVLALTRNNGQVLWR